MDDEHSPKIEVMEPAHGEDAVYYHDLNIVVISPRVPRCQWPRAILELQAEWRARVHPSLRRVS